MKKHRLVLTLALLLFAEAFALFAQEQQGSPRPLHPMPGTEKKLAAFEQKAKENPIPQGGILLLGSSTMEIWGRSHWGKGIELSGGEPIITHGVGGTTFRFVSDYFPRLVLDYRPSRIFLYSGDNDIGEGRGGERVALGVLETATGVLARLRERFPETPIYVISIKPSIKRAGAAPVQKIVNDGLKKFASENKKMFFLDGCSILIGDDGKPDPKYFAKDGLHLSEEGYLRWNKMLKEAIPEL